MRARSRWLISVTLGLCVLAGDSASTQAFAASCSTLKARLASVGSARPDRKRAARFEKAVARQKSELARTRRMARRSGCRARSGTVTCKRLNGTISQMEARIAELGGQRRKALGGKGSAATRRSIRAQMRKKGCGAPATKASVRPVERAKSEPKVRTVKRPVSTTSVTAPRANAVPSSGNYRSMCVRTCDGYYFPISNAVGPEGFRRDAARCDAMCPSADAKLFVHPRGTDVANMVDRVGRRYRSMPYAFTHQQPDYKPSKSCTCGRPSAPLPAQSALRGTTGAAEARMSLPLVGDDTETGRNAAVSFGWSEASGLVAKAIGPASSRGEIRVVGPRFLPAR